MDIPFRTDLITQTTLKYDTVPYTYRLQASCLLYTSDAADD